MTVQGDFGIHVVVADMIRLCADAGRVADRKGDIRLADAATSVRSALILHLDKTYAVLPEELREHYVYLTEQMQ